MVTSLPSSLSLSLSLSPSVFRAQYRKRGILRCTFSARERAKLIANFSSTLVTSLPSFPLSLSVSLSLSLSFSLSLSLSLSPSVPHAQYGPLSSMAALHGNTYKVNCWWALVGNRKPHYRPRLEIGRFRDSYIVREVHSVRERERYREREQHAELVRSHQKRVH